WYGLATSSDPLGRIAQASNGQNPQLDHGDAPKPDLTFDQLPGGAEAPVVPAVDVFASLDFDPKAISTPALPAAVEIDGRRPVVLGIAVDGGFWPVLMGALLWWIPLLIWVLGGLWALFGIVTSSRGLLLKAIWSAIVILIPVIGVMLYAAFGSGQRRVRRIAVVAAGSLAWLVVVVGALLIGGVF
ncbi:MAG: hypothetical protein OEM39_09210, partial [Acidimicrobiia bacterium]|nr:hypothetical protein [Acidimicrobiia bacterium]